MRLILAIVLLSSLAGCKPGGSPGGDGSTPPPPSVTPTAPHLWPGQRMTVVEEEIGGEVHTHETAAGTGASIRATGNDAAASHDASAPTAQLSGGVGGASGGSLRAQLSAINPETLMSNPLLWVGIAGIVGAGVALYFGLRRAALFLGIGGVGLIVAAMLPGWAWIVLSAIALVGGGVYLWAEYGGKRSHEALRAVAAGVADLADMAPESYKLVKTRVAAHADARDAKTIDKIKTEDRL